MFRQIESPYVGTTAAYMPRGRSPYDPMRGDGDSSVILYNGDRVTIESAWTRDYLPADAPTLYYVRSYVTGKCTHVTASDLHGVA